MLREMGATEFLHMIIRQTAAEQWFTGDPGQRMARYRIGENPFYVKFDADYNVTEISFNEGVDSVTVRPDKCTLFHESED